jgi:hypothetical protein
MRARLSLNTLRPCPNATPGPSSRPAIQVVRYNASRQIRYESTSTSAKSKTTPIFTSPNTATSAYPHPAFDQLSTSLSSWLPCFGARGDEVRLLNSPAGFYGDVIDMLKRAKRRILISTLYIGVEETELVGLPAEEGSKLMTRSRRYEKLYKQIHICVQHSYWIIIDPPDFRVRPLLHPVTRARPRRRNLSWHRRLHTYSYRSSRSLETE